MIKQTETILMTETLTDMNNNKKTVYKDAEDLHCERHFFLQREN